jgi:hypothetical protein
LNAGQYSSFDAIDEKSSEQTFRLGSVETGVTSSYQVVINLELSFQQLVAKMSSPGVGQKDGPYILRGPCDGCRADDNMCEGYVLVIDGDASIDLATGDINDVSAPSVELAHKSLKKLGLTHVLHTSHSHQRADKGNRWRAFIPTSRPYSKKEISSLTTILHERVQEAGCNVAQAKESSVFAQAWYLPRIVSVDAPFMALSFVGLPFDASLVATHPIKKVVPDDLVVALAEFAVLSRKPRPSVIQSFLNNQKLTELLLKNGYTKSRHNRWIHPNSSSGAPGLWVSDDGDICYSHNGTDPLCDGKAHDAFDVFCILEHGGDKASAMRSIDGFPDISNKGKPLPTIDNAKHLLELEGFIARYNQMNKEREFVIPSVELSNHNAGSNAIAHIKSVSAKSGLLAERMVEFALSIADSNQYHPARDWVESKAWDGESRFEQLLRSLGADSLEETRPLLRRWLISCIAALKEPRGVSAEGVLTLQGSQGCGKTSWLKGLTGSHQEFFRESAIINPSNKDTLKLSLSRWIAEAGELGASMRKADMDELKAFLTRDEDELRLPYAMAESKWPRRTIFCASVNDPEFLKDQTGNRRFWVVPVISPKINELPDMQQVWAEVATWYLAGENWHLSAEERHYVNAQNEGFMEVCPVEEKILSCFDWVSQTRNEPMTATQICEAVGLRNPTRAMARAAANAVRKKLKVLKPRKSSGRNLYDMPKLCLFSELEGTKDFY